MCFLSEKFQLHIPQRKNIFSRYQVLRLNKKLVVQDGMGRFELEPCFLFCFVLFFFLPKNCTTNVNKKFSWKSTLFNSSPEMIQNFWKFDDSEVKFNKSTMVKRSSIGCDIVPHSYQKVTNRLVSKFGADTFQIVRDLTSLI